MTLIEALKTGLRIKRPCYNIGSEFFTPQEGRQFSSSDVLSDEWEVEPDPKEELEVKRQKLRVIVSTSINRHTNYFGMAVMPFNDVEWMRDQLIKAWGEE